MQALFSLLTSSIASTFTGTTALNSPVITGITSTAGLFAGLPVSSARTPNTATILSVSAQPRSRCRRPRRRRAQVSPSPRGSGRPVGA